MIKIKKVGVFNSNLKKLLLEDATLSLLVKEREKLFRNSPSDTRLRNHALKRRLLGKWAFSITSNIRTLYKWNGKQSVTFLSIGKHSKVYKRDID